MTGNTHRPRPITTPPDPQEMARRLEAVRSRMAEVDLAAYVVVDVHNVYYLTNFANYVHERPFILVVFRDGPMRFVVPTLERAHVEARAIAPVDLLDYPEFPAPAGDEWSDRLADVLADTVAVGVESTCPLFVAAVLTGEPTPVDVVDEVRMLKSDYEIGRLAHAGTVVSDAHRETMDRVAPGDIMAMLAGDTTRSMTVRTLMDMPHTNMLASSFGAVIQPPSISWDPHNFTDVFLTMEQGGPHVSVINSVVNGYGAEIERTFFLNAVPDEARRPFAAMMAARELAFELTVPGADMAGVDRAVHACIADQGYGDHTLHRTGHSFGVTGHEAPFLAAGYERVITPGMVFSIEPGIYLDGDGGFRHSDTVLVTDRGNVSLTDAPDQLDDVTFTR